MQRLLKILKVIALSAAALLVLAFAATLFLAWREGAYPWTDRHGPDWATVHVQNDTRDTLAFEYIGPGFLDGSERDEAPKYDVDRGRRRDFGVLPRVFGTPLDADDEHGPAELALMLRLPGEELVLFPVWLGSREHVLVHVHADGRVTTSRGEESLIGWVSFGEEHAVAHAPPPGPPWRTLSVRAK